jgi:predicted dehydrogenase
VVNTAVLSFWHLHALDYVRQANENPDIDLRWAWDEDEARGREYAAKLRLEFVSDLDTLLALPDLDAVIVQTPTTDHHRIILRVAQAGKHIFSDKVLAATAREARQIIDACDSANVVLLTGMPYLFYDFMGGIKAVIDSGVLGRIVSVRISNCHGMALEGIIPDGFFNAREAGGGALIDLCAGAYLVPYLFGLPSTVFAQFASILDRGVEDSALLAFGFEDGKRIAVEVSIVTLGAPAFALEVYGMGGALQFQSDSQPSASGVSGHTVFQMRTDSQSDFEDVPVGVYPGSSLTQWVAHINGGTLAIENCKAAYDLAVVIEAAYAAASKGEVLAVAS